MYVNKRSPKGRDPSSPEPASGSEAAGKNRGGASDSHGSSRASSSVDSFLAERASLQLSKFDSPASSAHESPAPSEVAEACETVVEWAHAIAAHNPYGACSSNEASAALATLASAPQRGHAGKAYDTLLQLLAKGALNPTQAPAVRAHVQNNAEARIDALYQESYGDGAGKLMQARETLQWLGRFKLPQRSKQQLALMLAACANTGAVRPALLNAVRAPRGWTLGTPLLVDKQVYGTPPASRTQNTVPISVIRLTPHAGCLQGAAIAVLGPTFARGAYSKLKQIRLLPDAQLLSSSLQGSFVARQSVEDVDQDLARLFLRDKSYRPLRPTTDAQQDNETEALQLAHSELVPLLQFIDAKERHYDVLPEFLGSAAELLSEQPALRHNAAFVPTLLAGILPPLARLHARAWGHFDVKPDNFLMAASGPAAALADFGLSRPLAPTQRTVRGTYGFMAPEMLINNGMGVTSKADIFALAMSLVTMLAPDALARTLFKLPSKENLARNATLLARAQALRAPGQKELTPASLQRRVVALYLEDISSSYGRWYSARIDASMSAPSLDVAAAGIDAGPFAAFDALRAALQDTSPAFAPLMLRGLHPDPNVRDAVDHWQAALEAVPAPLPEQRDSMAKLLAQNSETSQMGRQRRAIAAALEDAAKALKEE